VLGVQHGWQPGARLGKKKRFREGQAEQTLDDLFFYFIEIAEKLRPRIVIAENVKGLLLGNAKFYVAGILREFMRAGYRVDFHLLDASRMGVPQKRERVFFLAIRDDVELATCDADGNIPS